MTRLDLPADIPTREGAFRAGDVVRCAITGGKYDVIDVFLRVRGRGEIRLEFPALAERFTLIRPADEGNA